MTPETVAALLAEAGLDSAVFDPAETADDLAGRLEMSATLNDLVADANEPAVDFDPSW